MPPPAVAGGRAGPDLTGDVTSSGGGGHSGATPPMGGTPDVHHEGRRRGRSARRPGRDRCLRLAPDSSSSASAARARRTPTGRLLRHVPEALGQHHPQGGGRVPSRRSARPATSPPTRGTATRCSSAPRRDARRRQARDLRRMQKGLSAADQKDVAGLRDLPDRRSAPGPGPAPAPRPHADPPRLTQRPGSDDLRGRPRRRRRQRPACGGQSIRPPARFTASMPCCTQVAVALGGAAADLHTTRT